jgi:hypothetical protein
MLHKHTPTHRTVPMAQTRDQNKGLHELVFSAVVCSEMNSRAGDPLHSDLPSISDPYIRFVGDPDYLLQRDLRLTRSAIKHKVGGYTIR